MVFTGFDGATFTNAPNSGVIFVTLKSFEERHRRSLSAISIRDDLRASLSPIKEAFVFVLEPPAVPGIGTGGGLKGYVQDRGGMGLTALEGATWGLAGPAMRLPGVAQAFTLFNTRTPQIFADIDRTKAEMIGVPISRVFETMSIYLGSVFVNDFNILGRTYRVMAQADNPHRLTLRDLSELKTRSATGEMTPLGAIATFRDTTGAFRVPRYNLYPAAELQMNLRAGHVSSGQGIAMIEGLAKQTLPPGFGFEWTEIALQEKLAGNTATLAFGLAVVFVFLLLAALYESLTLPLAVILIVPMCVLAAMSGVTLRGLRPQYSGRDRARRAHRPRRQERDPHCRIRAAGRRRRQGPFHRGDRGGAHAPAADPDDVARLHSRRAAARRCRMARARRCASRSASRCSAA